MSSGMRCCCFALGLVLMTGCSPGASTGSYLGYVDAEYVYVASPQNGWIVEMNAREGDVVAEGDALFSLDKDQAELARSEAEERVAQAQAQAADLSKGARPAEIAALQAKLQDAEAQFSLARSELDRTLPLVAKGAVAQAAADRAQTEFDRAQAGVKAAKEAIQVAKLGGREAAREAARAFASAASASLDQAEWLKGQRTVVARKAGTVELVVQRAGEFAVAGQPVLAILPENALKVRFFVPQDQVAGLAVGATVMVSADGLTEPVEGVVSYIARKAEFTPPVIYSKDVRDKLVFAVEARLPYSAQVRPGLPVDVRIP